MNVVFAGMKSQTLRATLSIFSLYAKHISYCFSEGCLPQSELLVFKKGKGMFFWKVSPSLGASGAHGHIRIPTFHEIPHASD